MYRLQNKMGRLFRKLLKKIVKFAPCWSCLYPNIVQMLHYLKVSVNKFLKSYKAKGFCCENVIFWQLSYPSSFSKLRTILHYMGKLYFLIKVGNIFNYKCNNFLSMQPHSLNALVRMFRVLRKRESACTFSISSLHSPQINNSKSFIKVN